MISSREASARPRPVERFRPTSGAIVGYAGLVVAAVVLGYVSFSVHTLTGLRVGLAMVLVGLVIWVTQLRPRAVAYEQTLLLKNAVRDVDVPLVLVDDVTVRQTLNVWVGEARYVCIGIGRSSRSMVKGRRRSAAAVLGLERLQEYAEHADRPGLDQSAVRYETWVVRRIEELAEHARRDADRAAPAPTVRRRVAWPETVALVVTALAFAVTLVV
jgi:hypothetical protein